MSLDLTRKICSLTQLEELAEKYHGRRRATVLCHGCFDIVHPGHLRYLQFARSQGDALVVSITGDDAIEKSDGTRPYVPQELRAENLAALELVDHVVIADSPTAQPIISALRPSVYVKGKEYEHNAHPGFLAEKQLVESYGGRVIYSSGQVVFSSTDLLDRLGPTLEAQGLDATYRIAASCKRWNVTSHTMHKLIHRGFANKRIAVIGDAIRDHYVFCDPANVAGEAPILSVRPLKETHYLGGAAIIAAHLKAMGAQPHLITTVGWDDASTDLIEQLGSRNVTATTFPTRRQLPVKQRYLVESQKLLKINHGDPQPLDSTTERKMIDVLADLRGDLDGVIFVDFGYGCVTSTLLDHAVPLLRGHVSALVGDVSGPQQSLLSMHDFDLLTPSERELRAVIGDFEQSLPSVTFSVMKKLNLANLAVTMGHHGCLLFSPREDDPKQWFNSRLRSQYLPTLATHAVDPLGAGDAYLAAATLALTADATIEQTGFIASAAAALEVGKIGNQAITLPELDAWISRQPSLLEPTILQPSNPALSITS